MNPVGKGVQTAFIKLMKERTRYLVSSLRRSTFYLSLITSCSHFILNLLGSITTALISAHLRYLLIYPIILLVVDSLLLLGFILQCYPRFSCFSLWQLYSNYLVLLYYLASSIALISIRSIASSSLLLLIIFTAIDLLCLGIILPITSWLWWILFPLESYDNILEFYDDHHYQNIAPSTQRNHVGRCTTVHMDSPFIETEDGANQPSLGLVISMW